MPHRIAKDSSEGSDARLIALEERIAHQDHVIAQLDEVVREFTARTESLQRQLDELRQSVGGEPEVGPADTPPPHY